MENFIISSLFQTHAIQVCPEDQPFWYTSGTLGPYYINTHYLYGSKEEAELLLKQIEEFSMDKITCPAKLFHEMESQYRNNSIFKGVIDLIIEKAKDLRFDFISGGERRDFFFSMLVANKLGKVHVSIFKDGTMVRSNPDFTSSSIAEKSEFKGKRALHIADLVTEASSYTRAWIPAVESLKAKITDTIAIVDRDQGGREILQKNGIPFHSFALIQEDLFKTALDHQYISGRQYMMILQFIDNPHKFMTDFFKQHPDFLEGQIALGGKAKERALLCIEKGFHLE